MYQIEVISPLKIRDRKHTVRYFVVAEATTEQAEQRLREYLRERDEPFEYMGEPFEVSEIFVRSFGSCTSKQLAEKLGTPAAAKPERKPQLRTKGIGFKQIAVLRSLTKHNSDWYPNCGWYWNTHSGTVTILESLAKRCLVDKISDYHYRINDNGIKLLAHHST